MEEQIRNFIEGAYNAAGMPYTDSDIESIIEVYGENPNEVVEVVGKVTGLDQETGWDANKYVSYLGGQSTEPNDEQIESSEPIEPTDPPTDTNPAKYAVEEGLENYDDIAHRKRLIEEKLSSPLSSEETTAYERQLEYVDALLDGNYDPIDVNKEYQARMEGRDDSERASVAGEILNETKLVRDLYSGAKESAQKAVDARYSSYTRDYTDQSPTEVIDEVIDALNNDQWEALDPWKQQLYASVFEDEDFNKYYASKVRFEQQNQILKSDFDEDMLKATQEWVTGEGQSHRTAIAEWINENVRFDSSLLKPVEYIGSAAATGLLMSKKGDVVEFDDYSSVTGSKSLEDMAIEDMVRLSEITKLEQDIQSKRPSIKTYLGDSTFTTFADEAPYAFISSIIAMMTQEELPQSAGTGAVAGSVLPGMGTIGGFGYGVAAGMSLGGLDMEFSAIIMDRAIKYAEENDMDATDPNDLKKIFSNKEFMSQAVADATIGSGIVMATDLVTLGVSSKIAGSAAKAFSKAASRQAYTNAVTAIAVEGAGGATGEFLKQTAIEEEYDWMEIALEGVAEFGTGPIQIGSVRLSEKQKHKARSQIISAAQQGDRKGFITGVESLYKKGAISENQRNQLVNDYDVAADIFKGIPEDIVATRAGREEAVSAIFERMSIDEQLETLNTKVAEAEEAFKPRIQQQIDKLTDKRNTLNEYIGSLGDIDIKLQDLALKNRLMPNLANKNETKNVTRADIKVENGIVSVPASFSPEATSFVQDVVDGTDGVTMNENQRVTYDQENDIWIRSGEQTREESGQVQDQEGGTEAAQAGGVLQTQEEEQADSQTVGEEEVTLRAQRPVTVFDVVDTVEEQNGSRTVPVTDANGNAGVMTVDEGGKVTVEIDNTIREIGNVEEVYDTPISELSEELPGLSVSTPIQPKGNFTYNMDGGVYANNYSNPLDAINYDEDGNITSVDLDRRVTVGGYAGRPTTQEFRRETITGPQAEELAYQIKLESYETNGQGRQFEEFITERFGTEEVQGATGEGTTQDNAGVRQTERPQPTKTEPVSGDRLQYQKADGTTTELIYTEGMGWRYPNTNRFRWQGKANEQWKNQQQQEPSGEPAGELTEARDANYDNFFEKYPDSAEKVADEDIIGVLNSFDNAAEMADTARTSYNIAGRKVDPGNYLYEVRDRLRNSLDQETFDRIKDRLNENGLIASQTYFGFTDETGQVSTQETGGTQTTEQETTEKPTPKPKPKERSTREKAAEFAKKMFGSKGKVTASTILEQIDKVKSAIAEIAPDVTFKVVNSEEMAKITGSIAARAPRGRYDSATNTIYINSDKATKNTVFHEAAHAVFVNMYGANDPRIVEIHKAIRDVLRNGNKEQQLLAEKIDSFIKDYQNTEGNPYMSSHEFFAELVGQLAADKEIIEKPTITRKIVNAINDTIEGILGVRPFEKESDVNDVIEFVNVLSINFNSGDVIPNANNLSKKKAEDINPSFDQRDPVTNEEYQDVADEDLKKGQLFQVSRKTVGFFNGWAVNDILIEGTVEDFTPNAIKLKNNDGTSHWIPRKSFYVEPQTGRILFKPNFGQSFNQNVTQDDINIMRLTYLQYPTLTQFELEDIFVNNLGIDVTRNQLVDILSLGEVAPQINSITSLDNAISTIIDFIPTIAGGLLEDYLITKGFKQSKRDIADRIKAYRNSPDLFKTPFMEQWILKRFNELSLTGMEAQDAYEQITSDLGLPGVDVTRVKPVVEMLVSQEKDFENNRGSYSGPNKFHAAGRYIPTAIKNIIKRIGELFTTYGKMPKEMKDMLDQMKAMITSMNYDTRTLADKLQKIVVANKLTRNDVLAMDRILKGSPPSNWRITVDKNGKPVKNADAVRAEILDILGEMRGKINAMSTAISTLASPYTDEMLINFMKLNDNYVTRIYMKWEASSWTKKDIDPTVWRRAKNYLITQNKDAVVYNERQIQDIQAEIAQVNQIPNPTEDDVRHLRILESRLQTHESYLKASNDRLASDENMEAYMDLLLETSEENYAVGKGTGKLDPISRDNILRKRSDLPQVMRDFYGEVQDPYVNFQFTMSRMAETYATTQTMEKIREIGLNAGWFSEAKTTQHPVELVVPTGRNQKISEKVMLGVTGNTLHTTPEINAALKSMNKTYARWIQSMFLFNAAVKKGFTIWSPKVHVRNFFSNGIFLMASGHFPMNMRELTESLSMLHADIPTVGPVVGLIGRGVKKLVAPKDARQRVMLEERRKRLTAKGTLGQTVDTKDLEFWLEKSIIGGGREKVTEDHLLNTLVDRKITSPKDYFTNPKKALGKDFKRAGKFIRGVDESWGKAYQIEDEIWKGYQVIREADQYGKALIGKSYKQLEKEIMLLKYDTDGKLKQLNEADQKRLDKLEADREMLEDKATEIVNNTLPNYANVYEFAKILRQTPLVGSFVSFPAEVIRVVRNQVRQALVDMKDSRTRSIGVKRMFGMAMVGLMTGFLADAISSWAFGWDDEERQKLDENMLPPWVPEAVWTTRGEDGRVNYFNPFAINPYAYVVGPLFAFEKKGLTMDAFWTSVERFFSPFVSPEIGVSTLLFGLYNIDPMTGRKITTAPRTDIRHYVDIWNRLGWSTSLFDKDVKKPGALSPGGIKTLARILDPKTRENELITLMTGVTSSSSNPTQSAFFRFKELGDTKKDLDTQVLTVLKTDGELTDRVRQKVDEMAADHAYYMEKALSMVETLKMLDVPYGEITRMLKNTAPDGSYRKTFNKAEIAWLMRGGKGKMPPYQFKASKYYGGYTLFARENANTNRTRKDVEEDIYKRNKEEIEKYPAEDYKPGSDFQGPMGDRIEDLLR